MELKDQSVVVIGGSSGIGLAIAQAAAKEGAKVLIASRSSEKINIAKQKIQGNIDTATIDLNSESSVKAFFDRHDKIDHLVTTAGSPKFKSIDDMDLAEAKTGFDDFFWRAFLVAKYGLPKVNKNGSLLLTSGIIAAKPFKGAPVLSAAVNAIEGFAKALAIDVAPIRVNVLCPGFTKTPLLGDNPEERLAERISKLLIKRLAEPEEMAKTALYFMTNGYITGQIIRVEGGMLLA
ncbi:MAG: SDR family oxidoreductase [Gammaproteobacteria bacterium]|nr:SDR family oxidoreductase [Gammaproteobacteria bacterium]